MECITCIDNPCVESQQDGGFCHDIEYIYGLVAAVFRRAIRDAVAGDEAALAWLAVVAPDWRDHVALTEGGDLILPGRLG